MPLRNRLVAINLLTPAPGSTSVGVRPSPNREVGRVAHEDDTCTRHVPYRNGIVPTSMSSCRSSALSTLAGQNKTDASGWALIRAAQNPLAPAQLTKRC